MTITDIYKKSGTIGEKLKFKNKYTWAGFYRIIDVRLFGLNDTFKHQTPLNDFVRRNGSILIFPNIVEGKMVSAIVRSMENDAFLKFSNADLPYGIGKLRKDFKYGDPLFLVEGIGDWAGVKLLGSEIDVVAMQTSEVPRDQYEIYSSITNNIVLIPDNDKAGRIGVAHMKSRFSKLGVTVSVIDQYSGLKDTGDILERTMMVDKTKSWAMKEELRLITKYYRNRINLYR